MGAGIAGAERPRSVKGTRLEGRDILSGTMGWPGAVVRVGDEASCLQGTRVQSNNQG